MAPATYATQAAPMMTYAAPAAPMTTAPMTYAAPTMAAPTGFDAIDRNHDGVISRAEFQAATQSVTVAQPVMQVAQPIMQYAAPPVMAAQPVVQTQPMPAVATMAQPQNIRPHPTLG